MRVFIAALVLIFSFQSWTKAEDISDFEIEGMSIGDSLLDYFSEEEILTQIKLNKHMYEYTTEKFGEVYKYSGLEQYYLMSFFVKPNDNKFIIHGIRGAMPHAEDIKSCYKDMNQVVESVSNMFKNAKKMETTYDHPIDKTGNSKVKEVYFLFKSDDEIKILCSDFEENLRIKNNWIDGLDVGIITKEVADWLAHRI